MQITIVDNDKALLRSLAIVLSGEGHHVTCFDDPLAAASAIGDGVVPDVLIVDYIMPGLDGIALLERVRPRLPRHARVIMISGHTDRLAAAQLATLRLGGLLRKPLDLDELCAHVNGTQKKG